MRLYYYTRIRTSWFAFGLIIILVSYCRLYVDTMDTTIWTESLHFSFFMAAASKIFSFPFSLTDVTEKAIAVELGGFGRRYPMIS